MFGVFRRSYGIFRQSLAVLANDKEILLFPLLSGISMLFVLAGMLGGGWFLGVFRVLVENGESGSGRALAYALVFAWYFVSWFVALFFNVAVIHCAKKRLDGGDPTVRDGLGAAWSHVGRIAAWAAISATVGLLARIARERGDQPGSSRLRSRGGRYRLPARPCSPTRLAPSATTACASSTATG